MIKKTGALLERPDLQSMAAGAHTRSIIDVYFKHFHGPLTVKKVV
jgi:hypothetical protein